MPDETIPNPAPEVDEEVKGPDPKVWGDDADRPSNVPTFEGQQLVGMVGDDGEEVKGPDPEHWG